jgi:hypothetical protein
MIRTQQAGTILVLTALIGAGTMRPAAANLNLVTTYDSSVTGSSQAATIEAAFDAVAAQFNAAIANNITVNVYVSLGSVNGQSLGTNVSGSFDNVVTMGSGAAASFANTKAALQAVGTVVGATDPAGPYATFVMPQAEVKALALSQALYPTTQPYDGYIGFTSSLSLLSFSGTPGGSQYSFKSAAMHEIQEVLGRTSYMNSGGIVYEYEATPMDLLRYTAPGTQTNNPATTAYASTDGGVTSLGTFATASTGAGDVTDWSTPVNTTSTDAQNALLTPGKVLGLSISDQKVLQGLGYSIVPGNTLFNGANAPVGATASVNAASQAAPEPATLSLLAAGAGLTCLLRSGVMRRRARRPNVA